MKNRVLFVFLFSCFFVFLFSGCQVEENYVTEYGFSDNLLANSRIQSKPNGVFIEVPFVDFSCETETFRAVLNRSKIKREFSLIISGTETEERCNKLFFAEILGVSPGKYSLKVIYEKTEEERLDVFYEKFEIK